MLKSGLLLEKWLNEQIERLSPGARLPTVTELSHQFQISGGTVKKILKIFTQAGKLESHPGKGTQIPNETKAGFVNKTENSIYEYIINTISSGQIRMGARMPQISSLAQQLYTSKKSITENFNSLCQKGFLKKVGRNYWVHSPDPYQSEKKHKIIAIIAQSESDLEECFSTGKIKPELEYLPMAFATMENELIRFSCQLLYSSISEWKDQKCDALVFLNVTDKNLTAILGMVNRKSKLPLSASKKILFDWRSGTKMKELPLDHSQHFGISWGNTYKEKARRLALLTIERNYSHVNYYVNPELHGYRGLLDSIRIMIELHSIKSGFDFKIYVSPGEKKYTKQELLADFYQKEGVAKVLKRLKDSAFLQLKDFENAITIEEGAYQKNDKTKGKTLHFFLSPEEAIDAKIQLTQKEFIIGKHCGIITIGDHPLLLKHQISVLLPDWERLGYMMAHCLLESSNIARGKKGFFKTPILFKDRGSV